MISGISPIHETINELVREVNNLNDRVYELEEGESEKSFPKWTTGEKERIAGLIIIFINMWSISGVDNFTVKNSIVKSDELKITMDAMCDIIKKREVY